MTMFGIITGMYFLYHCYDSGVLHALMMPLQIMEEYIRWTIG